MISIRRIGRLAGIALVSLLTAMVSLGLFLRLDKKHVFYQTRGDYTGTEVVESWHTETSLVRLVEPRNRRGEVPAAAYVRRPRQLADDHRLILIYAGLKTGAKVLDLIPERDDVVLVAPQYPYKSPEGLWEHLGLPHEVRRISYRTVAGGMLALSFLEESEDLDLGRLTVIGASLGSAYAVLLGALDQRVPRVVLIHGGGDFPAIIRHLERRRGRPFIGEMEAWLAALLVDTFDPIHHVDKIAPRELILIGARGDGYYPARSVLALHERAGEPKTLIWTETQHVRSRKVSIIEETLRLVEEQLDGR